MLPKSSEDKNPEETASASYPKLRMQFTYSLVCDVIEFICNLKLFKAINRNYFNDADSLIIFFPINAQIPCFVL